MQITRERPYVGSPDSNNDDIEKLSRDYEIHRKDEVADFIKFHQEIIPYIEKITPIINRYFPNYKKCITFCEDYEFKELNDITIYINSSKTTFDSDWEVFRELEIKILKLKEIPRKINTLISMDLWYDE